MASSRRPPRDPLPAPYESPWLALRRAAVAVLASLRLKLWELWRRNAQADLPRPSLWPDALAPLFWPLLLALVALLLAALLRAAVPWWRPGSPPTAQPPAPVAGERELPAAVSAGADAPEPGAAPGPGEPPGAPSRAPRSWRLPPFAGEPLLGQGEGQEPPAPWNEGAAAGEEGLPPGAAGQRQATPEPSPQDGSPVAVRPDRAAGGGPPPPSSPEQSDEPTRLLALLQAEVPGAPLLAARPEPAEALLRLQLSPGFGAAPLQQRQAWADRWLELAHQQGYRDLVLVDGAGRPLGRQARIGSGMILLQPLTERR